MARAVKGQKVRAPPELILQLSFGFIPARLSELISYVDLLMTMSPLSNVLGTWYFGNFRLDLNGHGGFQVYDCMQKMVSNIENK